MTVGQSVRHAQRIVQQFSRQAASLAAAGGGEHDEAIRRLLAATRVAPDDIVLDVACGTGHVALALAGIARHVTGIDLTPAMIHRARALQSETGLQNLRWLVGSVAPLPFAAASFSLVTCRYALHHLTDPPTAVAEMTRVCRLAGRVALVDVVTTREKASMYDRWERLRDPSHVQALTLDQLLALARENRLSRLTCQFYSFEIELETLLSGSFPASGDEAKVRELAIQDVGHDRLGVRARWRGTELVVSYPIAMIVGERTVEKRP
jgi:ubiquinone/menaquinone biosynthesis C-methylase UbiE